MLTIRNPHEHVANVHIQHITFWSCRHEAPNIAVSKFEPTTITLEKQSESAVLVASVTGPKKELMQQTSRHVPPISMLA